MNTDFTTDVCRDAMIKIVENVFHTMLAAEVVAGTGSGAEDPELTAFIDFMGACKAELSLQCSCMEARRLACLFMGTDETVDDGESRDAMGELLNIIAGNLKPMLPKGTRTTLPSVVQGTGRRSYQGEALFIEAPFKLDDGMFCLTFAQNQIEGGTAGAGGWD